MIPVPLVFILWLSVVDLPNFHFTHSTPQCVFPVHHRRLYDIFFAPRRTSTACQEEALMSSISPPDVYEAIIKRSRITAR
jgi:hypothetical protein